MKNDLISLKEKNIVVTGAAQGIGRAIVERALSLQARVVAVDLNAAALAALRDQFGADRVLTVVGDVSDRELAQRVVGHAVAQLGAVHGLVNNAGITRTAMIEKMTMEQWQQVIDVHLTGAFSFLQAVGRHMLTRARAGAESPGAIVNVSSDAGRRGTIGQVNYGAAKAGVLGLTMCAAREWGKYNIRVNTIGFGVVETPMTETIRGAKFAEGYLKQIPLNRWASAEEVARPVCFLLSDAASYITGQHLSANGGMAIGM